MSDQVGTSIKSFVVFASQEDDIHAFYAQHPGGTITIRMPELYPDAGKERDWAFPEIQWPPRRYRITIEEIPEDDL